MKEPLLKDTETAKRLNVSVFTLRNWRVDGKGPKWVTLGRAVRYRPEDLEQYIEQNKVGRN